MAWLAAAPKPDPRSRRAKEASQDEPVSRLEAMKARGIIPEMPPNPMPHLINWLVEMGLTEPAGMGIGPVGWQTIDAWCRRTFIALAPWEARLIRHLSVSYVAENRRAEVEGCPAPWRASVTQREKELEIEGLRALIQGSSR